MWLSHEESNEKKNEKYSRRNSCSFIKTNESHSTIYQMGTAPDDIDPYEIIKIGKEREKNCNAKKTQQNRTKQNTNAEITKTYKSPGWINVTSV